mmetsp:Transcript_55938/g.130726  ORF Transcript_55938/g.130726 Transcript_55938/m.130726 type:complete len:209 (-) Transcript_55938:1077-1703(-)
MGTSFALMIPISGASKKSCTFWLSTTPSCAPKAAFNKENECISGGCFAPALNFLTMSLARPLFTFRKTAFCRPVRRFSKGLPVALIIEPAVWLRLRCIVDFAKPLASSKDSSAGRVWSLSSGLRSASAQWMLTYSEMSRHTFGTWSFPFIVLKETAVTILTLIGFFPARFSARIAESLRLVRTSISAPSATTVGLISSTCFWYICTSS